jgi:hypothetical protein
MKTTSERIREMVVAAKPQLLKIPPDDASKKLRPDTWSKKEVLGHLIDSASNNHQRFVRAAQNIAGDFPTYNQNRWVEVQRYNEMNWSDLVELFSQYNLHLCRVIELLPREVLNNPCNIGKENPVTLEFVIEDYLRHLGHHIEEMLGPLA